MPLTPPARVARAALALPLAALLGLGLAAPATARPASVGADPGAATVSIVVPVALESDDGSGLVSAETLAIATSPSGSLTRLLDELLGTTATIALDPMIPASIRALGTAAPDAARAWLDRLEAAPNEVFLLSYADADLTALARAGALDLAVPPRIPVDPANFGPAATPLPTPSDSATPTATPTPVETPDDDGPPPLPTTEELLAWPDPVGRIAWPAEGSVAAADLAGYSAAGYDAVLVSSANVSETESARADLGGITGLVADSAASELLEQAATALDDATLEAAVERLGVAVDGLAAAHPGRSIVLTIDRATASRLHGFDETYTALVARGSARVTGLSAVLAGEPESSLVVDGPTSEHVARTPELVEALAAEDAFATILEDPVLLTGPRRLEFLALLAVQDATAEDWPGRGEAFLTRSAEILSSVAIEDSGDLLVTSTQTFVPVHIANSLQFPVTVQVDARPLRPRLRIESPVDVTIEPGSSKIVNLDAQAVTNGEVLVVVSLSSPSTGVEIGRARSFNADLQAQWETVGLIVGGGVVLVFLAGIARNVVVRRRAAAERAPEGEG